MTALRIPRRDRVPFVTSPRVDFQNRSRLSKQQNQQFFTDRKILRGFCHVCSESDSPGCDDLFPVLLAAGVMMEMVLREVPLNAMRDLH